MQQVDALGEHEPPPALADAEEKLKAAEDNDRRAELRVREAERKSVVAEERVAALDKELGSLETKLETPLLHRAMDVLREDPARMVSVGEWANALGVSREHLTRSISPTISPHALLQAARVCVALAHLARQDKLRAGEALDSMGYNSRAHASAVFKRVTGVTPSEFWNRVHSERPMHSECVLGRCPLLGAMLEHHHGFAHRYPGPR